MTGVQEHFSRYQEEQMDFQITMGNRTKCTPVGRDTIAFQTEAVTSIQATNVLHVPGLGMNLISVSQLQDKGYDVYFIRKKVYVKHPGWKRKKKIGVRSNKLYRLQLESPMALIGSNYNGEKERNELWHRRMGHLHDGELRMLRDTVTGVPVLSKEHNDFCKGCVLGKALSGGEYFITFIDDHSRKNWIYFLKTKDEAFDRFREFKALVENMTRKKIKVLRLDNGGEYTDKDFTHFYAKESIKREWTTPYNLE
eukprot:PITA_27262